MHAGNESLFRIETGPTPFPRLSVLFVRPSQLVFHRSLSWDGRWRDE